MHSFFFKKNAGILVILTTQLLHALSSSDLLLLADEVVEQIVETLQDFFSDYSQWLASDFHMGRVIKDVCHHLVTRYIAQLVEKKPMAKRSAFRCVPLCARRRGQR